MEELSQMLNGSCKFIVFGNDPKLNKSEFQLKNHDIKISQLGVEEDHWLMSQCDYLIGPPSTFSMWASFMGKTKFYHIYSPEETITLDKFSVCLHEED